MKKIFLSLLFVTFCCTINAQNVIDRQLIKDSPNAISPFIDEDISLLSTTFNNISEVQLKELQRLYYYKYKTLTSEIAGEELEAYIASVKEKMEEILGETLYIQISENQALFDRVSGQVYINQE